MSNMEPDTHVFQHSIAVSLKRIADSLDSIELLLTPTRVVGTSHADEPMKSAVGLWSDAVGINLFDRDVPLYAVDAFFGPGVISVDSDGVAHIARLD